MSIEVDVRVDGDEHIAAIMTLFADGKKPSRVQVAMVLTWIMDDVLRQLGIAAETTPAPISPVKA